MKLNSNALCPSLVPAITSLQKYVFKHILTKKELEIASQIDRTLRRLDTDVKKLILLNNKLLEGDALDIYHDEEAGILHLTIGGHQMEIRMKRADPSVPIKIGEGATLVGYKANSLDALEDENIVRMKLEMESLLVNFYYSCFKVMRILGKLIGKNTGKKNYNCEEITMVRNWLFEHADDLDIESYAFSSTGPVVRPIANIGRRWSDAGLVPNTESFATSIIKLLD